MIKIVVAMCVCTFLLVGVAYAQYPHVPKKDGTYYSRQNDLWELAQDYVFYRNIILKCAREGDQAGAAKARASFQQVTRWLSQYNDSDVAKAVQQAEQLRGGR